MKRAPWLLLALLLTAVGCSGGGGPAVPAGAPPLPPAPTPEEIAAQRAEKDRSYKTDEDSPIPPEQRETFSGLSYYPYDPQWRMMVHLDRYLDPIPFVITTTGGVERPAVKVGRIRFERDGQTHTLNVYTLRDLPPEAWNSLFLPFMDATTGKETYPAGRYVELAKVSDDWYVLDFNLSYNPLCAYGRTIYRCPATPAENRLPIAVRAGEKGYGMHGGESR